jgi:hypothetical protein
MEADVDGGPSRSSTSPSPAAAASDPIVASAVYVTITMRR